LEILTVYTIAFGFLSTTDILKDFGSITEDMTDPNVFKFTLGNFVFLAIVFSAVATALSPRKTSFNWFYPFEMIIIIVLAMIAFAYAIFHVLVVIPISYIAYAMVSVPIRAIQTSADDEGISISRYLFSWDEIPGNDNGKLIEFLIDKFGIDWVKTAEIEKIDNGNTIKISTEINHLSLNLNQEKTEVIFKIDDVRTDKIMAKMENGKLNIIGEQTITAKGIFSSENEVAMRSFLIGISAVVLQIVIPMLLNIASTLMKTVAGA
jgi:hypothetical protein